MDGTWTALARESALAAEHLGIGATAIGKANYAQVAYYHQAFFALSVGIERSCKLVLVLGHALQGDGAFPEPRILKGYGHNLIRLVGAAEGTANELLSATNGASTHLAPSEPVHGAILEVLSDFSRNITRYYNLESLTSVDVQDPVGEWYSRVIVPVLDLKYVGRHRRYREHKADAIASMLASYSVFRAHLEDGTLVSDAATLARHSAAVDFAAPWVRMYVLHFAKFLGNVLTDLARACQASGLEVPDIFDFYRAFLAPDRFFRSKSVWSIST